MHLIFFAMRFFPFWAVPLALLMFELGRLAARRKSKKRFIFYSIGAVFILFSTMWIVFGGGSQSDQWVRAIFG